MGISHGVNREPEAMSSVGMGGGVERGLKGFSWAPKDERLGLPGGKGKEQASQVREQHVQKQRV